MRDHCRFWDICNYWQTLCFITKAEFWLLSQTKKHLVKWPKRKWANERSFRKSWYFFLRTCIVCVIVYGLVITKIHTYILDFSQTRTSSLCIFTLDHYGIRLKQKSSIFKGSSLRFPQKPFIKQEYYIPCCQQFERILVYTITKEKLINQKWKSLQIPPSFYGTSKHFNYLNFPC